MNAAMTVAADMTSNRRDGFTDVVFDLFGQETRTGPHHHEPTHHCWGPRQRMAFGWLWPPMVNSSLVSKRSSLRRCRSALRTEAKLETGGRTAREVIASPPGVWDQREGEARSRQNGPVEQPSRASVLPVMACCYASRSVETVSRDRRPSVGERRSVPHPCVRSAVAGIPLLVEGHSPQTAGHVV